MRITTIVAATLVGPGLVACNVYKPPTGQTGGQGGEPATGNRGGDDTSGGTAPAGGVRATGGEVASTGGTSTGGAQATGGVIATGGTPADGGVPATGGSALGGVSATGGSAGFAGAPATGGGDVVGGDPATGGSGTVDGGAGGISATGGVPATGGGVAEGGALSTGGVSPTGGIPPTGGLPPTGGVTATGGFGGVFEDDFENGATQWTVTQGTCTITTDGSSVLTCTNGGNEARATAGALGWTDLTITADVKINQMDTSRRIYLAGRYADANNWYGAGFYNATTRQVQIRKKVDGSSEDIASANFPFELGTWYTLTFEISGSSLALSVDDVLLLEATDTEFASGAVALLADRSEVSWDNIVVTIP